MLSFPRDLWVSIAGTGSKQRINTAFSRGPDVLVATLQQNFGIPIQHFVEVDFVGFKGLVDAVGGVPVYFENPAHDKNTGLNIPVSGCVTLSGDQALAYARSRHYEYRSGDRWRTDGTGDLGRISRQQDFIRRTLVKAVARGVRNPIVLNELIDVGIRNVTVDSGLSARDLIRLGNRFRELDPSKIDMYTVPITPTSINGAAVLLVQEEAAQPVFDVFRGEPTETDDGTAKPPASTVPPSTVQVQVLNGAGVRGLAGQTSEALASIGFEVVDLVMRTAPSTTARSSGTRRAKRAPPERSPRYLESGADLQPVNEVATGDVVVILGRDFTEVNATPITVPSGDSGSAATTTPVPSSTTVVGVIPPAEAACG